MRVAALYDVHGNLPALEAVLAEIPDDAAIVVGGDVTAGPLPAETLERLRALGERVRWIRGNADRELTRASRGWRRRRDRLGARAALRGADRVPARAAGAARAGGRRRRPRPVLPRHRRRTTRTSSSREPPRRPSRRSFAGVEADLVVCGHTHMQFSREIAGIRVVNAGSVGMPYDDEPGAYWAGARAWRSSTGARRTTRRRSRARRFRATTSAVDRPSQGRGHRFFGTHASVPELVEVGRVGRPHGLDGSFVVENASEDPRRFEVGCDPLGGRRVAGPSWSRRSAPGGRPVIALDREVPRGAALEVPAAALPPPEEDAYYVFQLVGLAVEEEGGRPLGRVQPRRAGRRQRRARARLGARAAAPRGLRARGRRRQAAGSLSLGASRTLANLIPRLRPARCLHPRPVRLRVAHRATARSPRVLGTRLRPAALQLPRLHAAQRAARSTTSRTAAAPGCCFAWMLSAAALDAVYGGRSRASRRGADTAGAAARPGGGRGACRTRSA